MELTTFRLNEDVDEHAFLRADAAVQAFHHLQPGLLRRTTFRDIANGEWMVAVLWSSWEQADAAADVARTHAAMQEYASMIDATSVQVRRFESLG